LSGFNLDKTLETNVFVNPLGKLCIPNALFGLMNAGNYVGAEKIYTEDLTTWPKNGFALTGLYESLKAQRKLKEAVDVKKQLDAAWKYADSDLKYLRMDETKRKNLTLKVDANSPHEVIYLASSICMAKVK
jgi:hypothetical protein